MNWLAIYPEIVLLTMACVITPVDLWVEHPLRTPTYLSVAGDAGRRRGDALLPIFDGGRDFYGMQRMVVTDPLGHLLGFFAAIAVMVTLAYSRPTRRTEACSRASSSRSPCSRARHLGDGWRRTTS